MKLSIHIELAGKEYLVGALVGNDTDDAKFMYDEEYMGSDIGIPISISLPFQKEAFQPQRSRRFFEGLLPEGFTRRTVAQRLHADEADYLQILAALGKECIGALKVTDEEAMEPPFFDYQKISMEDVRDLAREGASKSAEFVTKAHLSLTGASGKVGLYFDEKNKEWYLPRGDAPSTHIVKQSHVRLAAIVTNEQLAMRTAKELGLDVPESFVINTGGGSDEEILFAVQRYDRTFANADRRVNGMVCPIRLHQEDFAQALGIASSAKYERADERHMKAAFELLRNYSVNPLEDQMKLWEFIVFDFLIGNTDAHLKNFSLLYEWNGRGLRLAPAYDMVSTTIYKQQTRDMAFRIGGVHSIDEIKRETFADAAREIGIGQKIALKTFDKLAQEFESALMRASEILQEQGVENAETIKRQILESGGYRNVS